MLLMVMMDQCSPKEFESWLYAQEDLLNQMSDNLICAIFEINYNKIDNDSFKDCLLFKHYHLFDQKFVRILPVVRIGK